MLKLVNMLKVDVTGISGNIGQNLIFQNNIDTQFHFNSVTQNKKILKNRLVGQYLLHLADPGLVDVSHETDDFIDKHIKKYSELFNGNYDHMIYVSSAALYPKTTTPILSTETAAIHLNSLYNKLKHKFELKLLNKKNVCILRIPNFIGAIPKQGNFFEEYMQDCKVKKTVEIKNSLENINFITTDKFLAACKFIYLKRCHGIFNLEGTFNITLECLGRYIAEKSENHDILIKSSDPNLRYRLLQEEKLKNIGFEFNQADRQDQIKKLIETRLK